MQNKPAGNPLKLAMILGAISIYPFLAPSAIGAIASAETGTSTDGLEQVTYHFPGSTGSTRSRGFGNSYHFSDITATPTNANLEVSTYSALRDNDHGFAKAPILTESELNMNRNGLGSCNQIEGKGCRSSTSAIDDAYSYDFLLFQFDHDVVFESNWMIGSDSHGNPDGRVKVSYWIGDSAALNNGNLNGFDVSTLHFVSATSTRSGNGYASSVNFDGAVGDVLLFGAEYPGSGEYFRFDGLDIAVPSPVPVPASFWLFATAIMTLVVGKRDNQRS